MASIFEIVEKLRNGEEVVIQNQHQTVVMQQIELHGEQIGQLDPISFEPHSKGHTSLQLEKFKRKAVK